MILMPHPFLMYWFEIVTIPAIEYKIFLIVIIIFHLVVSGIIERIIVSTSLVDYITCRRFLKKKKVGYKVLK